MTFIKRTTVRHTQIAAGLALDGYLVYKKAKKHGGLQKGLFAWDSKIAAQTIIGHAVIITVAYGVEKFFVLPEYIEKQMESIDQLDELTLDNKQWLDNLPDRELGEFLSWFAISSDEMKNAIMLDPQSQWQLFKLHGHHEAETITIIGREF